MPEVVVEVSPRYKVHVEAGILSQLASYISETKIAVISDDIVGPLYAKFVVEVLEAANKEIFVYTVPHGEDSKSVEWFAKLLRQLTVDGFNRSSAVVALGGGVVGDLAGYVAASFMRGISVYQCPTSLLAMVDASVGGKTGINIPEGKNLVGAFWQPKAVFIDADVFDSLPDRQFKQGAAELFKHGLLADQSILASISSKEFSPQGDKDFLSDIVARSVKVKADVVAQDEKEAGIRAHLNLGHTLAHAIEAWSDHRVPHGEAVTYGLLFVAHIAKNRGFSDETERVRAFLKYVQPETLELKELEPLLAFIGRDKKHSAAKQRWVLLEKVAKAAIYDDVAVGELELAWQQFQEALA